MVKLHIKNHSDIFPFSKDKYSFVSSKKKKRENIKAEVLLYYIGVQVLRNKIRAERLVIVVKPPKQFLIIIIVFLLQTNTHYILVLFIYRATRMRKSSLVQRSSSRRKENGCVVLHRLLLPSGNLQIIFQPFSSLGNYYECIDNNFCIRYWKRL